MAKNGSSDKEFTESSGLLSTGNSKNPTFTSQSQSFSDDQHGMDDHANRSIVPILNETTSSPSLGDYGNEFVTLEVSDSYDDYSTALKLCKKIIVRPYNFLLKFVGWRKWRESDSIRLTRLNYLYSAFIFTMITGASIAQVTSCFDRSKSFVDNPEHHHRNIVACERHLITFEVFSYVLMLIAYGLAFWTFNIKEPEHLSSLIESVFLSFHDVYHKNLRRLKPFIVLLSILIAGAVFFVLSFVTSIIRMCALGLQHSDALIGWWLKNQSGNLTSKLDKQTHGFLLSGAFLGFMFFDLLYIAVMINYCSQCQLLTFYIDNLIDKVRNKKYDNLNQAIKEIDKVGGFLKTLNGKMSVITSLIFFILLSNLIFSYKDLIKPDQPGLNVAAGFLNTIQWLLIVTVPALLAARMTASGNQLRKLGQEIAVRPFYYSDTPDLELQFFLSFTQSTKYQVNLAFIPMQPSLVLGFCFVLLLFFSSGIVISQVDSVAWF